MVWQKQLIKVFLTLPPSMEIRPNDNKTYSDEKNPA